jgi:hypothetical protein
MTANTVVTNSTGGYTANTAADVGSVYGSALLISPLIKTTEDRLVSYVDNRTDPVLLEFLQHLIRNHPMFKAEFTAFMARKKMGIDSV